MTTDNALQMSRNSPVCRILLVDECGIETDYQNALQTSSYKIVTSLQSSAVLLREVEKQQPDLVLLALKCPSRLLLETLSTLASHAPTPVVLICQADKPALIPDILGAGVSSYIAGDLSVSRLPNVLTVAKLRYGYLQALQQEVEQAKHQLAERKWVEQAKSLLMERQGMTEDEAYRNMRKMAMNNGQKLIDIAKNIIAMMKLMDQSAQ